MYLLDNNSGIATYQHAVIKRKPENHAVMIY